MKRSFTRRVVIIGTILSCVRIALFSVLVYAEWSGQQSISLVPLVLALYPEALLIPNDVTLTIWSTVAFGVLLIAGSFLIGLLLAIILGLVSKRGER
jgi:ABC-type Fe3+ transport system permease subunit